MLYNLFENRDFVSVFAVALLAEGVDRNFFPDAAPDNAAAVALLAEGVDRNTGPAEVVRKWWVALLAEGVDRNLYEKLLDRELIRSPSSRRAWIEILSAPQLRLAACRRPPRGGRG